MVELEFGALGHGFIRQPAFKEVFFENIPLLGEQFFRAVRKDDADALHVEGFDVVGQFEIEVLNSKLRQALTAVDGRPNLRVRLQQQGGQPRSGGVKRSRTATRACTDDHNVVHVQPLR